MAGLHPCPDTPAPAAMLLQKYNNVEIDMKSCKRCHLCNAAGIRRAARLVGTASPIAAPGHHADARLGRYCRILWRWRICRRATNANAAWLVWWHVSGESGITR